MGAALDTKVWSGCGHKMEAAKSSAKLVELCLHWQFSYSNCGKFLPLVTSRTMA